MKRSWKKSWITEERLKRCWSASLVPATSSKQLQHWICSKAEEDYGLCSGDSGGDLVCGGKNAGITSVIIEGKNLRACDFHSPDLHLIRCGSRNTLSTFTSVCHQMRWLHFGIAEFDMSRVSPAYMDAALPRPTVHSPFVLFTATTIKLLLFYLVSLAFKYCLKLLYRFN